MQPTIDWDDLRVLLAVADRGSLLEASKALGCSHSTVVRRLDALEVALDASLVRRHRRGCDLTPAGESAVAQARAMAQAVRVTQRQVSGHRQTLRGTLRISIVEAGANILMPVLSGIRRAHPQLSFEVLHAEAPVDLEKGEADLAVRLTLGPDPDLMGRRHGVMASAPYAHKRLLENWDPWLDAPWTTMHASMGAIPQRSWEAKHVPEGLSWLKVNSAAMMLESVELGLGCGVVACMLADTNPDLVRLRAPDPTLNLELWTLYHRDLRHAARLRTVVEHLGAALHELKPLLEGKVPNAKEAQTLVRHVERSHWGQPAIACLSEQDVAG